MERYQPTLLPDFVDLAKRTPSELFPPSCRCNEVPEGQGEPLEPAEEFILSPQAAPAVRSLFKAGRSAARRGLAQLGLPSQAILRNEDRSPAWPKGIVGSITHTQGCAIAVVAHSSEVQGLGIDIELLDRKVSLNLVQKFAIPHEAEWVSASTDDEDQRWRLLRLLSAKEATFKTFYPLEKVDLGFLDVELTANKNGFSGVLHQSCSTDWQVGASFDVLQSVWNGYLVSTCWIST